MRRSRKWTESEHSSLQDMWGDVSIPTIAKRLNRTVAAVKIKAIKLGLGAHKQCGELITFLELLRAIGQEHNYSYLKIRLLRDGFPVKHKRIEKCKFMMVCIDDFWKWVEKNKGDISFANFEKYALGAEPEWVSDKRKADYSASVYTKEMWRKRDDERLINMLNANKHGYAEISAALRRTEGAVKRRMIDLGLEQRPIKAKPIPWTDDDTALLKELMRKGYGFEDIGVRLGRSALSCRGKAERLENPEYMKRCNRGKNSKSSCSGEHKA